MTLYAVILVALVACARPGSGTEDGTLTPGGSGSQMVESVCDRIQAACIFDDDKLLLRRMAYVESQDGHDPDTYRDGYHGGIWQVDQAFFDITKSTQAEYELYQYIQEIHIKFGINWENVVWEDCRRPLVSALAARLYIQYTSRNNHNGIPRDINSQADFWKTYYRTSGNTQDFIDKSNALETGCESTHGADIVFVLDGSGSIGNTDFERIKEFVKDVVRSFDISAYKIGVIQFSSRAYTEFNLNSYSTSDQIISAVDNIRYRGGSTYTHLALQTLVDYAFLPSNGGRTDGVPKVGIVLTDGRSNSPPSTIAEAERAHRAGIIMIAVGVGSSIEHSELEAIASEPKCLHLFLLTGFSEIEDLKYAIEKRTCEAPIVIQPGNNGTDTGGRIPPGDNLNCQIKIPSAGATISLSTLSGTHSTLFLAQDTYPSSVYYEERVDSSPQTPGVVYIRNPHSSFRNNEWIIFCNLIGSNNTDTNFTFGIRPGDTTHCGSSPCVYGDCVELIDGFRCDCFDGYTGRLCESEIPNPCEPNPCQNGGSCTPLSDVDFTCTCPPQYTGATCEQDTNPCNSSPCTYGTCIQLEDGFRCDCFDGYTGRLCESEIPNPCEPNPCQNGGSCTPLSDVDFTCTCHPQYTGATCEQEQPSDGYDCGDNNPCTPENIQEGNFYFPHQDPTKFVQCDEHGGCFVMPCAPGTVWDPDKNTCDHAP